MLDLKLPCLKFRIRIGKKSEDPFILKKSRQSQKLPTLNFELKRYLKGIKEGSRLNIL